MRLRWRFLALLLALGALVWVDWGRWFACLFPRPTAQDWRLDKARSSSISAAYVLEKERWLTFALPPRQQAIKLVTNADLPIHRRRDLAPVLPPELRWDYRVQVEVLDRNDRVLSHQDYHHRAGLTEYQETAAATAHITSSFYLHEELIPLDSRVMMIHLGAQANEAAQVRLRWLDGDDLLAGVVVRAYVREERPEYKLRHAWQRLSREKRQYLGRGNVYDTDLLSEQEKRQLVLRHWAAIAPDGVHGRDYRQRDLYVLKEKEGEEVREPQPPAGVLIEAGCRGVIPLPETGGTFRFVVQAQPTSLAPIPPAPIVLQWYGRGLSQRSTQRLPFNGSKGSCDRSFGGGLVDILAPQSVAVRVYAVPEDAREEQGLREDAEITPEPIYVWSYLSQDNGPIDFSTGHVRDEATPFRVDVRRLLPVAADSSLSARATVSYEFLNARDQVEQRGDLIVDRPPSLYDRLPPSQRDQRVSDPATFYFSVPAGIVGVRLRSRTPVLITAFNRPGELARQTRVPEDYYPFNRDDLEQRSWFLVRAERHEQLMLNNRVPILWLQPRPHEDDLELLAGLFQWQDYLPEGPWRARFLLTPREPAVPFRAEALLVTYRALTLNQDHALRFQLPPGRRELTPTCVYLGEAATPASLRIFVNGTLHHEVAVTGARGDFLLPPFPRPGSERDHTVKVVSSRPLRVYINQVDPGPAPALLKRLALQLDAPGLAFDYDKVSPDDELLSLTLFKKQSAKARTRLRVRLEAAETPAIGPHAGWTFRERFFDLQPAGGAPVPILETRDGFVDGGQVFFFVLGSDLRPGRYRSKIDLEGGPGGYVVLSRATPGPYEQRELFFEPAKNTGAK